MKINAVEVWQADLELKVPYTIAYKTTSSVESVFVLLESNNGIRGVGAASPSKEVVGTTVTDSLIDLESIANQLTNHSFATLETALEWLHVNSKGNVGARIALDIALHDLYCKSLDTSVVDYYGQCHRSLPTSVTIGIMDVPSTLKEAKDFINSGFDHLKVKLGHDREEDVDRLRMLRENFGSSIYIRVDPNQGYSLDDLNWFIKNTRGLDIEIIEQPLSTIDFPKISQLQADDRFIIAADESLCTPEDARQLVSNENFPGIFNIKLMKCGGIQPAMQIADIAEANNINLMWGCNDESIISISAALHAAFACPNTKYLDLDGSFDLAADIATGGFIVQEGRMSLMQRPGLGVELL